MVIEEAIEISERIVLVRPISRFPSYDPEIQEPLGIELLAALLRTSGHEVLLLDAMLFPQTEKDIARRITQFRPQVVGLSLMSDADIESANTFICHIEDQSVTHVDWVVGGSFVSTEPERVASLLPEGTLLIRYEGEKPLLRLLEAMEKGEPLENVPSLIWRKGDRLNASSTCEWVENLDSLPWPARDSAKEIVARCGAMNVQGSRGCTGCCTYCCMPSMPRPSGQSWRGRSPESIAQELLDLNQRYGVVAFNFVDDDFLGPAQHAEERALAFAGAIYQRNLRIGFGAQLRPNTLTPKAVDALARAGLAWAFVGIENDDPATLRAWRRPPVTDSVWRTIKQLAEHHVEVAAGAILFHPSATLDAVQCFAHKLASHKMLNYRTATSRLHLLPGSHLYELYRREGLIPSNVSGSFTPPIQDTKVRDLFDYFTRSVAPLRPCWVHAACQLPGFVSQSKAGHPVTQKLRVIHSVLEDMDAWVCEVLNTLIAEITRDAVEPDWLTRAHSNSREIVLSACERLQKAGLVLDPGQLREAIDMEGGI